jgi:putative hydrolase of the HAD superfamily
VGEVSTIRAVGFDLDGTLFDHVGAATDGVEAFLRLLEVAPSDAALALWFAAEEECHALWKSGQISFQEQRRRRLQLFLPGIGIEAPQTPTGLDDLFEEYLRGYTAAWRAFPDAEDLLVSLRRSGIRVGVLTNGSQRQQVSKLQAIGLHDLLDVVLTAEGIGIWKPDRRAFELLAEQLGVAPAECLFVGDHPDQDVAGALSAGMHALIVDHSREDSKGLGPVATFAAMET